MAKETITLEIIARDLASGNISKAIAGIDRMAKQGGIVGSVFQGVGQKFGQMLNPVMLVSRGLDAVTDIMGSAVDAASDMAETQAKVGQVYKTSGADVLDWGRDAATAMGMSSQAALEAHATFGNFMQALGSTEEESRKMSGSLVQLAADLASFNNQNIEDVLVSLRSGMAGEAEPMRRLGADVSAARVEMELMEMGVEKVNGKFTESQKVMGRYQAIMEDTKAAQGDFERTSDGLANRQRTLDAKLKDVSASLGKSLLPAAEMATGALIFFADIVGTLSGGGGTGKLDELTASLDKTTDALNNNAQAAAAAEGQWAGTGSIFDSAIDGLFALQGAAEDLGLAPFAKTVKDWQDALRPMTQAIGATDAELYVLVKTAIEAGKTLEETTTAVEALWQSATSGEAERFRNYLPLVAQNFEDAGDAAEVAQQDAEDFAKSLAAGAERAKAATQRLAGQLDAVAGTSLPNLRSSAKENFAALVKAIESTGSPLRALKREEDTLLVLRAEAARKGQYWNEAAIDQRLAEIKVLKQAERAARDLYAASNRNAFMDIMVDTSSIDYAINKVRSLFGILNQSAPAPVAGEVTGGIGGAGRPEHRGLQEAERKRQQKAYADIRAEVHANARAQDDLAASTGGSSKATKEDAEATRAAAREKRKLADSIREVEAITGEDYLKKGTKSLEAYRKAAERANADLEKQFERVKEAADKVSEGIKAIGEVDFVDLQASGQAALEEIRASLEAQIDPIGVLKADEAALMELRAQAAAQARWDVVAMIDLRLEENRVLQEQMVLVQKRYTEEGNALQLLMDKMDIGKKKAQELLELYAKRSEADDLTDLELVRLIVRSQHRAAGGPVYAGQSYIVGERGPERITMRGNGYVTPNDALGGGFVYAPMFSSASPAEAQRFAQTITPFIERERRRIA